jgi:hypothetical protein
VLGFPYPALAPDFAFIQNMVGLRSIPSIVVTPAYAPTYLVGPTMLLGPAVPGSRLFPALPGAAMGAYSPFSRLSKVTVPPTFLPGDWKSIAQIDMMAIQPDRTFNNLPIRGVVGTCMQASDCAATGQSCDLGNKTCAPTCTLSGDCAPYGLVCRLDQKACVGTIACTTDMDCTPFGVHCNQDTGKCGG